MVGWFLLCHGWGQGWIACVPVIHARMRGHGMPLLVRPHPQKANSREDC